MATSRLRASWRSLESLFNAGALGGMTDGELLECFLGGRDTIGPEAFRILVERHGPMVLGLCRSVVRDPHDADDAFQATFLVLVRKADSITRRDTIGPWLYGVAGRVARRARDRAIRRKRREVGANAEIPSTERPIAESPSVEEIVQDEIARLPEPFRGPLVLCCLEGLSYELAANRLGLTEPALRGRLFRARERLASRLRERGITAGLFATGVGPFRLMQPPVPFSLVETTVHLSIRWSSVTGLLAGAGLVPDSISALAQGVIKAMLMQSVKLSGVIALVAAGALGTMVVAQQAKKAGDPRVPPVITANALPQDERAKTAQAERAELGEQEQQRLNEAARQATDKKTQLIKQKLDQVIDAEFPGLVTLADLLKHIRKATTDADYPGIPIYVNPIGLQEAEQSMGVAIEVNRKQCSVREVLWWALHPLQLSYIIKDGFLMIDSRTSVTEMRVEEMERKLDRVLESLERLGKAAK
jgi:RNA polymerase sigma factor (sigma-70 family)